MIGYKHFFFSVFAFTGLLPGATLVSHWSFDDATANDPVNGQNGVFTNGATTTAAITASRLGGRALDVSDMVLPTNARVVVANSPTLQIADNLSISFWMRANYDPLDASLGQVGSYTRVMAMNQGGTTDPGWEFQRDNNGLANQVRIDTTAGGNSVRGPTNRNEFNGQWHHNVVTLASGNGVIYNNGVASAFTYPHGGGFADTLANLVFGANSSGGSQFDGWLDDISLWGTSALTAGEAGGLFSLAQVMGYDASDASQLFALHTAAAGTQVVNGAEWRYVNGLSGTPGSLSLVNGQRVLFLTATTGVAVPEPGKIALSLLGLTGLLLSRRRRGSSGQR